MVGGEDDDGVLDGGPFRRDAEAEVLVRVLELASEDRGLLAGLQPRAFGDPVADGLAAQMSFARKRERLFGGRFQNIAVTCSFRITRIFTE